MMKKVFGLMLALALTVAMAVPAFADGGDTLSYITDDAGILDTELRADLESRAQALAQQYGCGLYVVILEDYTPFGGDINMACDNIYEAYFLGQETGGNAIVMLLSMAERDYYIEDYGSYGMDVLTDYGRETLEEAMLDDFRNDDWATGLTDYLDQGEVLLKSAWEGTPVDLPEATPVERAMVYYGFSLVVGVVAAFITCTVFKLQMKTAVAATSAEEYVSPTGVNMLVRNDRFTHTTRTQRKLEKKSGGSKAGKKSGGGGKF